MQHAVVSSADLSLLQDIHERIDHALNLARCQDLALAYPNHWPNRDASEQVQPELINAVIESLLAGISDDLSHYLEPQRHRAMEASLAAYRRRGAWRRPPESQANGDVHPEDGEGAPN